LRIYRVLRVRSSKGELAVKALFDAEMSFTVVRRDVAEKIGHILPTDVREVTLADGKTKLKVLGYIPISTVPEGSPIDDIAYVVEELAEELIVGSRLWSLRHQAGPSTNRVIVGRNYSSSELYAHN